jgi:peptide/nickel transport system substrate-binding protein
MTRYLSKVLVFAAVLSLVAACGKSSTNTVVSPPAASGVSGPAGTTSASSLPQGGTLNLALESDVSAAFDPQKEYYSVTWEFLRCCLLRTLMSYNGHDTTQHGAEVFPDLASEAPTVSSDGLTWTFKLKPGVKYAPPITATVTSGDIVRALEREACTECAAGGYSFYFSVIKGFDDYGAGKAKTITGLSTPDDNTLVVTLTQPAGDLPFRFAMPATAPIPPSLSGNATLGVADGHDKDYGRFLVATGPYMFQGADQIDFSKPGASQKPAAGYVPGKSITLVRNPNWDRSTDDPRLANRRRDRRPDHQRIGRGPGGQGGLGRAGRGLRRGSPDRPAPEVRDGPQPQGPDPDPSVRCRSVHLREPGPAALRRHPRSEGDQLRDRQGRVAEAAGWSRLR